MKIKTFPEVLYQSAAGALVFQRNERIFSRITINSVRKSVFTASRIFLTHIKRDLITFVCVTAAVALTVSGILKYGGSTGSVGETSDIPHISSDLKKSHVFHEGCMRGVWVPYFSLASDGGFSEEEFKKNFDSIVKNAKKHGINTLFVHVRSHCDAAYISDIFPMSESYKPNGKRSYDPLAYMTKSAHKAGLELHAWINPYRISSDSEEIPEDSPCKKWEGSRRIIEYNGGLYLNPSDPQVRSLIISGVRELVGRYDIDGVHLDDYFYAFTEDYPDKEDYNAYLDSVSDNAHALTLSQWRAANVSALISGINSAVKAIDSKTLFGISPQGNPENNKDIGADVYSWCSENGYIDYIAPQIYFNDENPVCPFEPTLERWKSIVTNDKTELYIGLALYKAGSDEDDGTWLGGGIIASQARLALEQNTGGFILYSSEQLDDPQTESELLDLDKLIEGLDR